MNQNQIKLGVLIFPTSYCMPIDALARALEARGFESLFVCEHTHIPASRKTPWPGGADLPKQYYHTLDPYVALTAAAMVTRELKLGTGVTLLTQHDPLVLAKTVASLDLLSGGRVLLGIGAGWNVEEMTNHGTAYKTRWALLRERALSMRELWREENVAEYADGWMPIYQDAARAAQSEALDYAAGIKAVKAAWKERGRDGEPQFNLFGVPAKRSIIAGMAELGFSRQLLGLPSADADTLLPILDKYAALAHERV